MRATTFPTFTQSFPQLGHVPSKLKRPRGTTVEPCPRGSATTITDLPSPAPSRRQKAALRRVEERGIEALIEILKESGAKARGPLQACEGNLRSLDNGDAIRFLEAASSMPSVLSFCQSLGLLDRLSLGEIKSLSPKLKAEIILGCDPHNKFLSQLSATEIIDAALALDPKLDSTRARQIKIINRFAMLQSPPTMSASETLRLYEFAQRLSSLAGFTKIAFHASRNDFSWLNAERFQNIVETELNMGDFELITEASLRSAELAPYDEALIQACKGKHDTRTLKDFAKRLLLSQNRCEALSPATRNLLEQSSHEGPKGVGRRAGTEVFGRSGLAASPGPHFSAVLEGAEKS